jgi:hypothetical protein
VGRFNGKKLQHVTQINNAHMLVKVFNNQWRTSTAEVTILWSIFSRRSILNFLKCHCDQIFIFVFFPWLWRMRIKKLSRKILAWYLIFCLSYTTMKFEFWRSPLKSAILESSSARDSVTS